MLVLNNLLFWQSLAATVVVYSASLIFYRLFLHPLSRFPGSKLAAISRWYEAYYDVVQNGQYTFKIAEMHRQYGPIIRISPHELHINDPCFYENLYRQEGIWHKYAWAIDALATSGAAIFTADHNLHKARRQPMNAFFSKSRVANRQELIRKHLGKLTSRLSKFTESQEQFNFGAAVTALARDVANEFILAKSYNSLEQDDFEVDLLLASQGSGAIWRLSKHMRFVSPTLRSIPMEWIIKIGDTATRTFFRFLQETTQDTEKLVAAVVSGDETPRTIVHEILASKLPAHEKTPARIFEDVTTVTSAGFETTASVLRVIFFHVFNNHKILRRLRTELSSVPATADLKTLEQLPYLTSVLKEGLRLSPAIATRMARIAPDRDLVYGEWRIPASTPVGMTTILMHTDENIYAEPKRFAPERWIDDDQLKRGETVFAPFSRGTRNCLGMYLAWAELYISVAKIAECFDLQFIGVEAEDLECTSDQFAIGTRSGGLLNATVARKAPV